MKIIVATDGSPIKVSDEDFAGLSQHRWWIVRRPSRGLAYAHTKMPNGDRVYMHRLVTGATKGQVAHHKNDDTLDNQRENLVACTQADNVRRRRGNAGASGYRGVQFVPGHAHGRPWRARIKVNGKFLFLGHHGTRRHAIDAYNAAAVEHFGEFARPHA